MKLEKLVFSVQAAHFTRNLSSLQTSKLEVTTRSRVNQLQNDKKVNVNCKTTIERQTLVLLKQQQRDFKPSQQNTQVYLVMRRILV